MSLMYSLLNENTDYDYDNYGYDDNELFEESGTYFCEGVDGLFEISAESEASWGNIMCETLLAEHIASFNEDVEMLQEADDSFFKKVQEWVKDKARKLKQFFTNLINRIKLSVTNTEKFYTANQKYINNPTGNVVISTNRTWKVKDVTKLVTFSSKIIGEVQSAGSSNRILTFLKNKKLDAGNGFNGVFEFACEEIGIKNVKNGPELKKNLSDEFVTVSESAKEVTISAGEVAKYGKNLIGAKAGLKTIQMGEKSANAVLAGILAAAKSGTDDFKKEDKTRLVTYRKQLSSVLDTVIGTTTSLYMQLIADSLKICKKAVKNSK